MKIGNFGVFANGKAQASFLKLVTAEEQRQPPMWSFAPIISSQIVCERQGFLHFTTPTLNQQTPVLNPELRHF